jgi:hypothetical protein
MISDSVGESVPELTEAFLEALRKRSQVPALVDVLEPVSADCALPLHGPWLTSCRAPHRFWPKRRCPSWSATGAVCSSTRSVWLRLRRRRDGPTPRELCLHVSPAPSLCASPLQPQCYINHRRSSAWPCCRCAHVWLASELAGRRRGSLTRAKREQQRCGCGALPSRLLCSQLSLSSHQRLSCCD